MGLAAFTLHAGTLALEHIHKTASALLAAIEDCRLVASDFDPGLVLNGL